MFQDTAPAINPWLQPTVVLFVLGQLLFFVAWLVRMEYKTNANEKRQGEYEETRGEERKEERQEFRNLKQAFYAHATDSKVHHNEEMFKEFRAGLDRRFSGLEGTLLEINRKLDHLNEK